MTLSLGQPKFKTCPNCGGDGFENNPPMRKCGICKGTGKVWEKGPIHHRREGQKWAHSASRGPGATRCQSGQGAS
jgi:DnaJ-class molecular chaperone